MTGLALITARVRRIIRRVVGPRRCPMTTCNARPGQPHTMACIARRAGWGEDVTDELAP